MKLLAWDTSSKAGAIAALEWADGGSTSWENVRLAGEWSLSVDSRHSERLLWGIHQMLEAARWKLDEVDAFAVGVGPGSFTGLRIGLTTARTLAEAQGKPLIGVSSLAALARPAALWLRALGREKTVIIASTDACKGELFVLMGDSRSIGRRITAKGVSVEAGRARYAYKERVMEPMTLAQEAREKVLALSARERGWLRVGEGKSRYPEAWKMLPASSEIVPGEAFTDQVQGRYLGMLAFESWQAGLARPAMDVHPRYLRASDAEVKLKSGALRPAPSAPPPGCE